MSDIVKIYVAGASDEIDRAKLWMDRLRERGFDVVSTWPQVIIEKQAGQANPRDASDDARRELAEGNLDQVEEADLLWMLAPKNKSHGAYGEFCFAYRCDITLISSGNTKQSVFNALGREFETDSEAFDFIIRETFGA